TMASDKARGLNAGGGERSPNRSSAGLALLELGELALQLVQPLARPEQHFALDVELLARDQIEARKDAAQHGAYIAFEVLRRARLEHLAQPLAHLVHQPGSIATHWPTSTRFEASVASAATSAR